jgi:hypothetical protein
MNVHQLSKAPVTKSALELTGYAFLLVGFVLSCALDSWFPIGIVKLFAGLLLLFVIPGELLAAAIFDKNWPRGLGFMLGAAANTLFIAMEFVLAFFTGMGYPLDLWLSACNMILVLLLTIITSGRVRFLSPTYWLENIRLPQNRLPYSLFCLALAVRLALMAIGSSAFSPDAGMFFDYAHEINVGQFQSHVMGDLGALSRGPFVDELFHQSSGFLFALSYMLMPWSGDSPTILLVIMGSLVVVGVYEIMSRLFGQRCAYIGALMVAMQPTLAYFSAIANGASTFSLAFVVYLALLLIVKDGTSRRRLASIGVFLGLIESIWFLNFYQAIFLICATSLIAGVPDRKRSLLLSVFLFCVLVSRQVMQNTIIYLTVWLFIIASFPVARFFRRDVRWHEYWPLFSSIFFMFELFYLPAQIAQYAQYVPVNMIAQSLFVRVLTGFPSAEYLAAMSVFLLWHITPPVVVLAVGGLVLRGKERNERLLAWITVISTAMTVEAMSTFEPIELQYFYTSPAYALLAILLVTMMGVVALTRLDSTKTKDNGGTADIAGKNLKRTPFRIKAMAVLLVCFIPGFVVGIYRVDFVRPDLRYGWQGIASWIDTNTGIEDKIVVDRARELAWLTQRYSVSLDSMNASIPTEWGALRAVQQLATQYSANLFLLDHYTVAHWNHFSYLLNSSLKPNLAIPTNASQLVDAANKTNVSDITSMYLIAQTQPNADGYYVRVFNFTLSNYTILWHLFLLGPDWSAGNGGSLLNESGHTRLEIGSSKNSSYTWRPGGFDLGVSVNTGFFLCSVHDEGASVDSIFVLDENGTVAQHAEPLGNGLYYCLLGRLVVGDIQIHIKGLEGEGVLVNSISLWGCTP